MVVMPVSPLKLVSLNIEGHRHLEERVIPFLQAEQPDVISLQEVFLSDVSRLVKALDMDSFYVPMAEIATQTVHHEPLGRWGVAQFTRLPVISHGFAYYQGDLQHLPTFHPDEPNSMNRVVSWVEVQQGDQRFTCATTHFTWSTAGEATEEQRQSLVALEQVLDRYLPEVVLSGDFNAPRGRATFDRLAERYRDNIPPQYQTSIDPDLHKAGALQLMVDGLFTSPQFQVREARLQTGLSDHQGIVASITRR